MMTMMGRSTMRWLTRGTLAALTVLLVAGPGSAQAAAGDRAGVERAALDYLEGFYEGDPSKLERSVHPEVLKFGFARRDGDYQRVPMSFEEMLGFAERVRAQGQQPGSDAPKRVEILDVLDQTAVAKVYAWWGSDYLSMARYEGEWKIVQVLWQSPPPG